MKTYVHPKSCKRILIKVLFIKAQNKNSPHVHQLMKGYVYLYIHSMEYYTAIKKEQNIETCYNSENIKIIYAEWRNTDKKIIYTL